MLQVSSLTKCYGDRTLFEDVTFSMIRGERLGLIGRNGSGKSTIFRLVLGSETADEGTITVPRGYRVGHLAQHLNFTEPTILAEACLGLPEEERDQEYRAEIILGGLGFSESDYLRAPSEFSGGFQIRLNLAKLLLSEPNLLLLDEPTNYLDIVSVRWLTNFLKAWRDELIIVSHDRLFMDSVTTHTMLIHRGAVRKIAGGTAKLYDLIKVDEEVYEKTRINEDKKRRDLEEFITRFRAQASKATLVQSKVKALERMGQKAELSAIEELSFEFREAPFPSKTIAEATGITFHYPNGPTLIDNLSLAINKKDRIGIIGKNGRGKSTLLKLLAGELTPDTGSVTLSPHARLGYFGQTNIARLNPKLTIEQEIESANQMLNRTSVRSICGAMMFSGDDGEKKIGVLSGGEKSRVLLGKILALQTNLLLLDEPTNHLDMESIESLMVSLEKYDGAVILVTHSELLLKRLTTKLVVFQGDAPRLLQHGYDYFLETEGWNEEHQGPTGHKDQGAAAKERAEKNVQKKIAQLESKIIRLEKEQKAAEAGLEEATNNQDMDQISDFAVKIGELAQSIDEAFEELGKLSKA